MKLGARSAGREIITLPGAKFPLIYELTTEDEYRDNVNAWGKKFGMTPLEIEAGIDKVSGRLSRRLFEGSSWLSRGQLESKEKAPKKAASKKHTTADVGPTVNDI